MAVFHRVEVDIVEVAAPVFFIANQVLPEPWLPQGLAVVRRNRASDAGGDEPLDETPAGGKVGVALG